MIVLLVMVQYLAHFMAGLVTVIQITVVINFRTTVVMDMVIK
jgi:hypothetical protein